jgi:adenine deaminase
VLSPFRLMIELELSIAITKGGLIISSLELEIIGLMSKSSSPKRDKKRKKAKNRFILDLFLALYMY